MHHQLFGVLDLANVVAAGGTVDRFIVLVRMHAPWTEVLGVAAASDGLCGTGMDLLESRHARSANDLVSLDDVDRVVRHDHAVDPGSVGMFAE